MDDLPIPVNEAKLYLNPIEFEAYKNAYIAFYDACLTGGINEVFSAQHKTSNASRVIPKGTPAHIDVLLKTYQLGCMKADWVNGNRFKNIRESSDPEFKTQTLALIREMEDQENTYKQEIRREGVQI